MFFFLFVLALFGSVSIIEISRLRIKTISIAT